MRVALMAPTGGIKNAFRMSTTEFFKAVGGNTGNLAFVASISSHLKNEAIVVPWEIRPEKLSEIADIVVFAGANQLGPHADLEGLAKLFERAKLPVIILGLGAQAADLQVDTVIPEGTIRWLKVVSDLAPSSAPNIGVRGEYTLNQLDRLGLSRHAIVAGCPSNFLNLETDFPSEIEARQQQPIRRIISAVGQHRWGMLGAIERSLLDLVDVGFGSCVVQSGDLMVRLGHGDLGTISEDDFENMRSYFRPELSTEAFALWCRRNMQAFGNLESWMSWISEHDFVVGPRFHGIMLAIQSGIPAGCIAHDSRTMELCNTMGIPVQKATDVPLPITFDSLTKLFQFDSKSYREKRRNLARSYISILESAKLNFDERLLLQIN